MEPVVQIDTAFVMQTVGEQALELKALRIKLAQLEAKLKEAEEPREPAPAS